MNTSTSHTGTTLDTVEGVEIVDCATCGFAHVTPFPTDEELRQFYEKEFYDSEKTDYFKDAEEDVAWWMSTYDHYYDLFEGHTDGRRLLDIGSGPGYFLDAGVRRKWDVLGFEPSPAAAHYSQKRGLTVINDMFTAEKASGHAPFDVVMLSLVLEHVPHAEQLITEAKKVLAPKGLLCVIVPNDYNPLQKILVTQYGFKPWWVVPKHHLNYFTIASLTELLGSRGFVPVETETSYPMELFLLAGRNYIGNPDVGRACHKERKTLELGLFAGNKALLQSMYREWAKEGIGREVVLIARKAG